MARHFSARRDLYGSKAASDITSETYYVGDADAISLFVRGSPSTTTLQGSNEDGRNVDIKNTGAADWSTLSTVINPSPDMIDIEPGFAYLRATRSETTELILTLQNKA